MQRISLANEAASILAKTRRVTPFGAAPALLADEIIAMTEYLRLGDATPPEKEPAVSGDFVEVAKLRVGDEFVAAGGTVFAVVRDPMAKGTMISVKARPVPGGIARQLDFDLDSTVEALNRGTLVEVGLVFVGELVVGDVIIDFGDGPVEPERVTKIKRPQVGKVIEVTTVDPRIDEEIQAAGTHAMVVDRQVTVRFPRP
jgi:hypothetical protein